MGGSIATILAEMEDDDNSDMNKLYLRYQWFGSADELVDWYNENRLTKTINIVTIISDGGGYKLFYYGN